MTFKDRSSREEDEIRKAIIAIAIAMSFVAAGVLAAGAQASATDDTYGVGYWKNHPEEVEALWDDHWLQLGNKPGGEPFWVDLDNATNLLHCVCVYTHVHAGYIGYYRLAAQLVAAELNVLNGADGTAIQDTIDASLYVLANMGLPSYWFGLEKSEKQYVISLTEALELFNS